MKIKVSRRGYDRSLRDLVPGPFGVLTAVPNNSEEQIGDLGIHTEVEWYFPATNFFLDSERPNIDQYRIYPLTSGDTITITL